MESPQMKIENDEKEKQDKNKPFKLCFIDRNVLGQSHIKIGKPLTIAPIVPLKFYDPRNEKISQELIDKYYKLLTSDQDLDKRFLPKTENQRYGWYQVQLTDTDRTDRRLYFHKRTNVLVYEHLMNYAKIRE